MPNIPLLDREELDDDGKALWDDIVRARGTMVTSYRSLLNSPGATRGVSQLGEHLRYHSEHDDRARELAVLVVNRDTRCEFGWIQHAILAEKMGVSPEAIEVIRGGGIPDDVTPAERTSMVAAHEALSLGAVTPQTLRELYDHFGLRGGLEMVLAIGYYTMLAQYFLAMDLRVEPELLKTLDIGPKPADAGRADTGEEER